MAGFGWNWRHGTHGSKRPLPPSHIACRICDHVFMSTQALIDHIESHMVEDDTASRRQNGPNPFSSSRTDPFSNPFSFSLSTPTRFSQTGPLGRNRYNFLSLTERNPIFGASTPQNLVPAQPITPQAHPWLARNNKYSNMRSQHVPLTFPTQPKVIEEPPNIDCTRPFLQQLERPFSYSKLGFQESNGKHKNRSDLGTLDLSLKL
ncbi:unnamed protein product [Dovyalis caffra]|uniref:C2H2-type domain-containing protein n=1 Tax=Dovyalis caffra TaxID=77055 RepID=A0AAV1R0N1_9ROSI|nr:unnamed protein product [Dovyalis caffra]